MWCPNKVNVNIKEANACCWMGNEIKTAILKCNYVMIRKRFVFSSFFIRHTHFTSYRVYSVICMYRMDGWWLKAMANIKQVNGLKRVIIFSASFIKTCTQQLKSSKKHMVGANHGGGNRLVLLHIICTGWSFFLFTNVWKILWLHKKVF